MDFLLGLYDDDKVISNSCRVSMTTPCLSTVVITNANFTAACQVKLEIP